MSIIIARSSPSCNTGGGNIPTTTLCLPISNVQRYVDIGATSVLDTFPATRALAMKWYVVLSTISGSKDRAFEIVATERNGLITFCTYSILGDQMDCEVVVEYNLGSYELVCTNIETEGVVAYAVRTFVPPSAVSTAIANTVNVEHISSIVPGASTTIIDEVRKERNQAIKWTITITDGAGEEHTSQVFSLPAVGLGNNYALVGKHTPSIKINVIDDTQNVNLVVINSSPSDVRVVATRMPVTPELPQQCDVPSDISAWIPPQSIIAASSAGVADEQIPIPGHAAVRWLVVVQQASHKRVFEVVANRTKLSDVSYVQYGMIGDRVQVNAEVTLVGLSFVLTIHNNTLDAATINIIRVPTAV